MATFKYVGRNYQGVSIKGKVESSTINSAADLLMGKKIIPIKIKEKKCSFSGSILSKIFPQKIKLTDLIIFTRQMHSLAKAGIPILTAITGLAGSTNSKILKNSLNDILEQMIKGNILSVAMGRHPNVFPPLYLSLVQVGENTGKLDLVFIQLVNYLEQENETKKRLKAATQYPMFVLLTLVFAMLILNIYVIPVFANMFAKFDGELPWSTRVLLTTSWFFVHYWHLLLLFIIGSMGSFKFWLQSKKGSYLFDKWKLQIPIIGSIIERILLARFSRSFSMILSAGISLDNSLYLISYSIDNNYMKEKILAMREAIGTGSSLLKTATDVNLFTPLVLQMISIGEDTGKIDQLLEDVADFYDREITYDLKNLTATIEPLLISVVSIMVLILSLGIFTPMWDLMGAMKSIG